MSLLLISAKIRVLHIYASISASEMTYVVSDGASKLYPLSHSSIVVFCA